MNYSFHLCDVVMDIPMVDLEATSNDGTRQASICAFGVVAIFLPPLLLQLTAIEAREPSATDLPEAVRGQAKRQFGKLVFLNDSLGEYGFILCREAMLLSHDGTRQRVAFNNEEIRRDPSTRVVFDWTLRGGVQPRRFDLPKDASLYDPPS